MQRKQVGQPHNDDKYNLKKSLHKIVKIYAWACFTVILPMVFRKMTLCSCHFHVISVIYNDIYAWAQGDRYHERVSERER